ncbi:MULTISPECIES: 30S ribosomal protein S6 [Sporomusa]|uniref:Small ribosomal subunit protein bS6 n=1 Tax=Sporomusa termitida TaxID=2377 RepID=A0A517E0B9_9FIRM|nr:MULTISPECIES: 30S ribosomal protein S6 [Sporomusa]MDF2875917.1 rpsF [Sporomusa sp.]QDR83054.1 30S ribosomal protein S6 [Sporomusa termitida]HWR10011.1 30S ribosomal protein S6 [Sporomusa sp.]
MRKYEVVIIVKPNDEEVTNATIAKFENIIKNTGGTIDKVDRWGKKRLAYEVKDFMEGYYTLINFTAEPATVFELERVLKITDEILKHMVIRLED